MPWQFDEPQPRAGLAATASGSFDSPASITDCSGGNSLANGQFDLGDFGWTTRGDVRIVDAAAVLAEDATFIPGLAQAFTIPSEAQSLELTLDVTHLGTSPGQPADAVELALLAAATGQSLVATAAGLSQTDALLNIQATGQTYVAPRVAIPGLGSSGDFLSLERPLTIQIELDLGLVQPGPADGMIDFLLELGLVRENASEMAFKSVSQGLTGGYVMQGKQTVTDDLTETGDYSTGQVQRTRHKENDALVSQTGSNQTFQYSQTQQTHQTTDLTDGHIDIASGQFSLTLTESITTQVVDQEEDNQSMHADVSGVTVVTTRIDKTGNNDSGEFQLGITTTTTSQDNTRTETNHDQRTEQDTVGSTTFVQTNVGNAKSREKGSLPVFAARWAP